MIHTTDEKNRDNSQKKALKQKKGGGRQGIRGGGCIFILTLLKLWASVKVSLCLTPQSSRSLHVVAWQQ